MRELSFIVINPQDIDDHVRKICAGHEEKAIGYAQEILHMLFRKTANNASIRPATAEEVRARDDDGILEWQAEMLGREFHFFEAALDPELNKLILQYAQYMAPRKTICADADLLADLTGQWGRAAAIPFNEMITPGTSVSSVRPGLRERQEMKKASVISANMRAQSRTSVRIYDHTWLKQIDNHFGNALPHLKRNDNFHYYKILDGDSQPRALLCIQKDVTGKETLMTCVNGPRRFADLRTREHLAQHMTQANIGVSRNIADTGLFMTKEGKILPLESLPEELITKKSFEIIDSKSDLSFGSLRKVFAQRNAISQCSGLVTLGSIESFNNTLYIGRCDNFNDIGALRTVGSEGGWSDLLIRNCKSLRSLSGLEEVHGNLDLRGTPVLHMPLSLKFVRGYVFLDKGTFRYIGYGSSQPLVPTSPYAARNLS